jgi:hypothetical protein
LTAVEVRFEFFESRLDFPSIHPPRKGCELRGVKERVTFPFAKGIE